MLIILSSKTASFFVCESAFEHIKFFSLDLIDHTFLCIFSLLQKWPLIKTVVELVMWKSVQF